MSIIGVTVGTPTSPKRIENEIKPVKTVNNQPPDDDGNVNVVGNNGADGKDGKDGVDGVSPTISVSPITGGHRITITDKDGTKNVDVMDGEDGNDGITPVKDVDYFDGKDGTSVTVTKVTESTEDGGSNAVTFSDGNTLTVKNGSKGGKGDPFTYEDFTAEQLAALKGTNGNDGRGIKSVTRTGGNGEAGTTDTYTITYTDNTTSTFTVCNGMDGRTPYIHDGEWWIGDIPLGVKAEGKDGVSITAAYINDIGQLCLDFTDGDSVAVGYVIGRDGDAGVGIANIAKTATNGKVDTYTITLTNGTKTTFAVTNGADGTDGKDADTVPDYIVAEAEAVADNVLAVRNANSIVIGMASDFHTKGEEANFSNGAPSSYESVKHAGQGMNEINKLIQLDLVALLGDYEFRDLDDEADDEEDAAKSFKHVRKSFYEVTNAVPTMWLQGNHDYTTGNTQAQKYYALIGANNVGMVTDYANKFRNYGYRDFENYKIRVIYLNTTDVASLSYTASVFVSTEQQNWLNNVALNFADKADKTEWGVIVLTHCPLNNTGDGIASVLTILNTFKGQTDTAKFIAHFNGNNHNFAVRTFGSNKIASITIPNVCFGRNNEYGTYSEYDAETKSKFGDVDADGNQRQFNKTSGTANDTAFNVVVIDRENERIHAFNYGAGIDRIITFNGDVIYEGEFTPDTPIPDAPIEPPSETIIPMTWTDSTRWGSDGTIRTGVTGYTTNKTPIDLSILENIGDTLTITGLRFEKAAASEISLPLYTNGAYTSSAHYYFMNDNAYDIPNTGVRINARTDYNVLTLERISAPSVSATYTINICGYGSGANAVITKKKADA